MEERRTPGAVIALILILAFVLGAGGYMGYELFLVPSGDSAQTSSEGDPSSGRSISREDAGAESAVAAGYRVSVSQVDNSAFPRVTMYTEILDANTGQRASSVDASALSITEISASDSRYEATIEEVTPLSSGDAMFLNLVLDHSSSMMSADRMNKAKQAANTFIDSMALSSGTQAEITAFNSYVSTPQPFSSDSVLLHSAVNDMYPDGDTALNDALYHAVQRTNKKSGSRVVIGFTDGEENDSNHSQEDVISIARATGIPVYLIGVGDSYDAAYLEDLAKACNGRYYSASDGDLTAALSDVYAQVYESQRNMFRIVFRSNFTSEERQFRTVQLDVDGERAAIHEYVPVDDVPEFDTTSRSEDYLLPDVATRDYSREELEHFSLWELYLARNEIFARHGRIFTNQQDLNDYFMQKDWYRPLYTGEEFAELDERVKQLNEHEDNNAELMIEIEKSRNSPYLSR